MWIPVKLVWSIQFSFFSRLIEALLWFALLISLFNEVISFLESWFLWFLSFNFRSCLRRFLYFLLCFYALFNHNQSIWSDFLCSRFPFMIPESTRPIQIVIYDWSTYLDFWRSFYTFFDFMTLWNWIWIWSWNVERCRRWHCQVGRNSLEKSLTDSMRNRWWSPICIKCMCQNWDAIVDCRAWWIDFGAVKLVSFPIHISLLFFQKIARRGKRGEVTNW